MTPTDTTTGHRTDTITILLEHYEDVLNGLRDHQGDGIHLPLMCRAWRKPHAGYPRLEQLLPIMRNEQPGLHWHLLETYLRPRHRRVLRCQHPGCTLTLPAWTHTAFHTHGRHHVRLVPATVRAPNPRASPEQVAAAIAWLEQRWGPKVALPDELVCVTSRCGCKGGECRREQGKRRMVAQA